MIYDISAPISEETAVWPGDTPFKRSIDMNIELGGNLTTSHIETTLHIGTHADAPSHYCAAGKSIDEIPLESYIGPCQLIDVSPLQEPFTITPSFVENLQIKAPRVLFKTNTFPNTCYWQTKFAHFDKEVIDILSRYGVKLIGIDTPSVDEFHSKSLEVHKKFLEYNMFNLEGLQLTSVPEGIYTLIALPLKLIKADASPVRAILKTIDLK